MRMSSQRLPSVSWTAYPLACQTPCMTRTHMPACKLRRSQSLRAAAQATTALLHCAAAWLLSGCHASGEVRVMQASQRCWQPLPPCCGALTGRVSLTLATSTAACAVHVQQCLRTTPCAHAFKEVSPHIASCSRSERPTVRHGSSCQCAGQNMRTAYDSVPAALQDVISAAGSQPGFHGGVAVGNRRLLEAAKAKPHAKPSGACRERSAACTCLPSCVLPAHLVCGGAAT